MPDKLMYIPNNNNTQNSLSCRLQLLVETCGHSTGHSTDRHMDGQTDIYDHKRNEVKKGEIIRKTAENLLEEPLINSANLKKAK